MKATAAGFPLMVTLTLARAVGRRPFWKSVSRQARVTAASEVPKRETQVPGAIAGPRPAALTTPLAAMVGFTTGTGVVRLNVTGMVTELLGTPATLRVSVPLYTAAARSLAVTATVSVEGVAAAEGATESHLPLGGAAVTAACKITLSPATVILRDCAGGSGPPATAKNASDEGVGWS